MIDIRELRIGNHVLFNDEPVQVEALDISELDPFVKHYANAIKWHHISEYKPIPITEELLKELGFNNGWQGTFDEYEITVTEQWEFGYSMGAYNVSIKNVLKSSHIAMVDGIKYLHELEQFVYLTTKKELKYDKSNQH